MSDMPERIWITKEESVIGLQRSFRASNLDHGEGWPQYHRADAPLTPAEAMARCPEVAALVEALKWYESQRRDALVRKERIAVVEDEAVLSLCQKYGYGAVIDSAARQWAQKDSKGAFFIGGCIGDTSTAAALAPFTKS